MDFLLDVHLPISLSKFLNNQKDCTAIHVNQILQKWNTTDKDICKYADEKNLVVVTKDDDFRNSHFINKTPKKVIRVILVLPLSVQSDLYIETDKDQITIID